MVFSSFKRRNSRIRVESHSMVRLSERISFICSIASERIYSGRSCINSSHDSSIFQIPSNPSLSICSLLISILFLALYFGRDVAHFGNSFLTQIFCLKSMFLVNEALFPLWKITFQFQQQSGESIHFLRHLLEIFCR
ncbi:hypothetical protein SDC9_168050 [bioreactor metagenome]|uniref:Uncharacterized protein n=1 Tax=bioreactor metagenome TaxID=1076179 RepID=A0A645G1H8_9ZZZZ